jgi:hypothetical protein
MEHFSTKIFQRCETVKLQESVGIGEFHRFKLSVVTEQGKF